MTETEINLLSDFAGLLCSFLFELIMDGSFPGWFGFFVCVCLAFVEIQSLSQVLLKP